MGGIPGTKPLVVDPFAGGGSIPLEALRIGADAFASDLNPVAVLLNKVVLECIPKYGQQLADEVRKWGRWIKEQGEKELCEFYPKDPDGALPIAYLWARTIKCEGPGCGVEVPLIHSLWLNKKKNNAMALEMTTYGSKKKVDFEIVEKKNGQWYIKNSKIKRKGKMSFYGTVKRGAAICPCCGFKTSSESVKKQLKNRKGGTNDARLITVITVYKKKKGRFFRLPIEQDFKSIELAHDTILKNDELSRYIPDEPTPKGGGRGAGRAFSQRNYGMNNFSDLFNYRQLVTLATFARLIHEVSKYKIKECESEFKKAVETCLAFALDTCADHNTALCTWRPNSLDVSHIFGRQAISMTWDYAETVSIGQSTGSFYGAIEKICRVIIRESNISESNSSSEKKSAQSYPLPDNSINYLFTDPPYYDAVPYADLSDFFIVWLKRTIKHNFSTLFDDELATKEDECILDEIKGKDKYFFEKTLSESIAEGRRILVSNGIGIIVFAHKSTSGWEVLLQAIINSGWMITASWPIDTELSTRLRGMGSAALISSIHLICRPRETMGSTLLASIGYWRDILQLLPMRIHEWMPRLQTEGIVGADAIFACLGPALEIFSRYSHVEKVSGEEVKLREYLEHVWAAVAKEALTMIFEGAESTGFEEDARLTAMWLWTISTGGNIKSGKEKEIPKSTGYFLEYDAVRKIAQGLGAHLEKLQHLIEIKGNKARLLPVIERTRHLFGKNSPLKTKKQRKHDPQIALFDTLDEAERENGWNIDEVHSIGKTTLDKVHQGMLLFASGRGAALKRFLVEQGAGRDPRFWQLAQALSALYPSHTDEKRWVDGLMAKKKSMGF